MSESKELFVTKHNSLIEASYKLSLNEQRLVLLCISKLNSRKPIPKENLFTITAKEFSLMFGINEKIAYRDLSNASKDLYKQDIRTHDGKYNYQVRWVYGVKYHDHEGKVTLGFSPWIAPYLTSLHERFTRYNLKKVSRLKSAYAIRLFEFLIQFKATGKLLINLDVFRDRLEIKNEYKRFCDLKRRVILPSVKELEEKSGLVINWKPIKSGKSVTKLEFIFRESEILDGEGNEEKERTCAA
jgi:plasmid replication initiation protein